MGFNNDDYLKGQIEKQYQKPKTSSVKQTLNQELYDVDERLMKKVIGRDIETLQGLVRDGEATYADIAKCFWNQVLKFKDHNAVIALNPDVVKGAEKLSYDRSHSLMYGIPVLVKDNIATQDMPTTAGAAVLKDFKPEEDAKIIKHLKDKGALILGKTNLSEWANFMSTDSSNGYSAIGGQTKNAFGEFDVGGSSSGSAVAAALGMAPVTIGSETSGSIIYPASQNGVVGHKPTLGLVSQRGIIPISKTHDTAGPITRTVKDAYALFKAMSDVEESADWDATRLSGLRIGIIDNRSIKAVYRAEDEEILSHVKNEFREASAEVTSIEIDEAAFDINYLNILKYEFNLGIRSYFEASSTLDLDKVLAFNKQNEPDYAPYNQELIRQSIEETYTDEEIAETIRLNQATARKALDEAFESVDVLVTLSNYSTVLYAAAGYPAVTVPGHKRSTGEPVGVTLIGKNKQDVKLLEWAYAYEQSLIREG
ncbi:amidase [Marinilactibacillus piezotolerans]|uniref:Amidase n=1 Tax=Marinilactibacillus piezotolerans TaxID=258723 RepID=A0A1I3ZUR3_9LACT|nr:amidase family protein [Marinilactibacillus piezotolerans]SFK47743.1 amidase [Marinilactibacillus piezotolerans]